MTFVLIFSKHARKIEKVLQKKLILINGYLYSPLQNKYREKVLTNQVLLAKLSGASIYLANEIYIANYIIILDLFL